MVQFKLCARFFELIRKGYVSQFHYGSIQIYSNGGSLGNEFYVSIPLWFNSNIELKVIPKTEIKDSLNSTMVQFK